MPYDPFASFSELLNIVSEVCLGALFLPVLLGFAGKGMPRRALLDPWRRNGGGLPGSAPAGSRPLYGSESSVAGLAAGIQEIGRFRPKRPPHNRNSLLAHRSTPTKKKRQAFKPASISLASVQFQRAVRKLQLINGRRLWLQQLVPISLNPRIPISRCDRCQSISACRRVP